MAKSLSALDRLLNDPDLPALVPTLQPAVLHRLIQARGLEDSVDVVALATPAQLAQVLDVDLWYAPISGADETLDADRFGRWLAVLMHAGAAVAAEKLAGLDIELIVAGFAQHLRVFDSAAVSSYTTLEGEQIAGRAPQGLANCEIGGYAIEAKRDGAWEPIGDLLAFLHAERPHYFHRLMSGCVALSSAPREHDGFHDLLEDGDQHMFEVASERETRREQQGFVTPAQAHAFLREARTLTLEAHRPPRSAVARAYFRAIGSTLALDIDPRRNDARVPDQADGETLARAQLSFVHAYAAAHAEAEEELAFLANVVIADGSVQGRPFTAREASDGAIAIANLGLENWTRHWGEPDLVTAFQAGWATLYRDVTLFVAKRLIEILLAIRCVDRDIQLRLDGLRHDLLDHVRKEEPWRARDGLDVIMMLDAPAWAGLSALLDRFPVMHAAVAAPERGRLSIDAAAFTFISQNAHIGAVRAFMAALPSVLTG